LETKEITHLATVLGKHKLNKNKLVEIKGGQKKSEYEEEAVGFAETSQSFDPKTKLTVGLSRYSSGGSCYLYYDGPRSQLRSYSDEQKAQLNANQQHFNGIIPMEKPTAAVKIPTENIPI